MNWVLGNCMERRLLQVLITYVALSLSSSVLAEDGLQGVIKADMNLQANPCEDFFDYANGKWRAENPIPPSMSRWSRRWAAGESSKDKLKVILEEAASSRSQPGSNEQLIGDFYAGCMNEREADRLGAQPLEPLLT